MRSDTQTVSIGVPPSRLYDFLREPENLPRWAVGFAKGIRRDGERWIVKTGQGEQELRYHLVPAEGVLDYHMFPVPGVEAVAPSRVVPNGEGSEYVFTFFQPDGMDDAVWNAQREALRRELGVLKSLVEAMDACPARDRP